MTIEEKLKNYVLSRFRSVREFCTVAEIPYSTFDSILKRGILNSGVGNIIKVCKSLDISADKLANEEIAPSENSSINLTHEEQDIILKYRSLDERGKSAVNETLEREFAYTKNFAEESLNRVING